MIIRVVYVIGTKSITKYFDDFKYVWDLAEKFKYVYDVDAIFFDVSFYYGNEEKSIRDSLKKSQGVKKE